MNQTETQNENVSDFQQKYTDIEELFAQQIERCMLNDEKDKAYYYRDLFSLVSKALYAYQVLQTFSTTLKTVLQF